MSLLRLLPLLLFCLLAGLFGVTFLTQADSFSSPLLNKPIPHFVLPNAIDPTKTLVSDQMKKPALLVFWASWCGVCKVDMPILGQFAQDKNIPLYGIAYHDRREPLQSAVNAMGNRVTFAGLAHDDVGTVSEQFGLVGVPTLFVIDKSGIIRFVVPGAVTKTMLEREIYPLLQ